MWKKRSPALIGLTAAMLLTLWPVGAAEQPGAKKSDAVIKIKAAATAPGADGKQVVTVTLDIDKPWHLYANPVPADFPGIPTTVTVSKVKPEDVKVEYPAGKLVKDAVVGDYKVYEGTVVLRATVQRDKTDQGPLELRIRLQACTDQQCLLPATVTLTAAPAK